MEGVRRYFHRGMKHVFKQTGLSQQLKMKDSLLIITQSPTTIVKNEICLSTLSFSLAGSVSDILLVSLRLAMTQRAVGISEQLEADAKNSKALLRHRK